MNIHLKSKDQFNTLLGATKLSVVVGSHLYQMNNSQSDTDILNITSNLTENQNSFLWTHNQFQYKENNTDFLFTSLNQFIRNLLTGDSTINFEALYSEEFKNSSSLQFLYEQRNQFITYNLIRSYLGLAKRDFKAYKKQKETYKLFHFIRGVDTANTLLNKNTYSNDFNESLKGLLLDVKNEKKSAGSISEILLEYESLMNKLREDLNTKLNSGLILRTMDTTSLIALDKYVQSWNQENISTGGLFDDQMYNSLFNDLSYE